MFRKKIKYTDYNGDEREEEFYFNITEEEVVMLEVEHKEGLYNWLDAMVKSEDRKTMLSEFKKIVLLAYGQKTPDGQSFMKSPEMSNAFQYHAAYNALFLELTSSEDASAQFILESLPKDLAERTKVAVAEQAKEEAKSEALKERERAMEKAATAEASTEVAVTPEP